MKLELLHRVDADTAVVEESEVYGTLEGSLFGILPPSHQLIHFRVVIFFPVQDQLFTGERIYVDSGEIVRQIPGAVWPFEE